MDTSEMLKKKFQITNVSLSLVSRLVKTSMKTLFRKCQLFNDRLNFHNQFTKKKMEKSLQFVLWTYSNRIIFEILEWDLFQC